MKKEISYKFDYMMSDKVCSTVTVYTDGSAESVDFVDELLLTAFGNQKDINEDDVMEFLEERCFPRTRDNCKQLLRDAGLDYYDPLAIVQKTGGRMCGDKFWLRFYEV